MLARLRSLLFPTLPALSALLAAALVGGACSATSEGDSEFTGPNFSPDRRTLFANVQQPGTVYAITGPWRAGS